jgi:hypothetical protein
MVLRNATLLPVMMIGVKITSCSLPLLWLNILPVLLLMVFDEQLT